MHGLDELTQHRIAAKVYDKHFEAGGGRLQKGLVMRTYELACGAVGHLGITIDQAIELTDYELLQLLIAKCEKQPENAELRCFLAIKLEDELGL